MGIGQSFEHDAEQSKLTWDVPSWPPDSDRAEPFPSPIANRSFAAGEIVERVYCLEMSDEKLVGTFLDPFIPRIPDSGGGCKKLWPFGWALLYELHAGNPNLRVEHVYEPAPPPPRPDGSLEAMAGDAEPRHWLLYRAARAIAAGEGLSVAPSAGQPLPADGTRQLFASAAQALDTTAFATGLARREAEAGKASASRSTSAAWRSRARSLVRWHMVGVEAPPTIGLYEADDCPAVVAASLTHGVGVFAARDIEKGEILEVNPTLPVEADDIADCILNEYAFESDFVTDDYNLCQFGFGPIYNHSDKANVAHYKFRDQSPYVEAWVAEAFIPCGQEICHDYGDSYFKDREMDKLRASYDTGSSLDFRAVRRGCC